MVGTCQPAWARSLRRRTHAGTDPATASKLLARAEELWAAAAKLEAAASSGRSVPARTHHPGSPVWAKEGGWPWWPALVITPQTADEHPQMKAQRELCSPWSCWHVGLLHGLEQSLCLGACPGHEPPDG